MHKVYLQVAAAFGAVAVVLGAFAAHKLKELYPQKALEIFETAVKYQFYHVFAIALVGVLYSTFPNKLMEAAGALFIGGIVLFSGSLYLLSYGNYSNMNMKWAGPVTPIGGLLFIAGWVCVVLAVRK